jgi:subtilisin family serine protease
VNLAAVLLPFVVALPPGAVAPPPGAVPRAAQITVLDRELGLVAVRLPKRGVAASLRRLRAGPGVRYVERDAPAALAGEGCATVGAEAQKAYPGWRSAIHLTRRSAAGMLVGIADSGVDDDRIAPLQAPLLKLSAGGDARPRDPFGHGTAVGSLLVANRPDVGVVGMVPDATLLSARIVRPKAKCSNAVLSQGLIAAFAWLRRQGAQVVNVSATVLPSRALIESLRALQLSGALVVAAVGNGGRVAPRDLFPASQPGVLGVGALAPRSSTQVWIDSTRGSQVDLVAPAEGVKVVASNAPGVSTSAETAITPPGTSFAAPLVTGAATMLWATHRDWTAAEVANALVRSATPLRRGGPNRDSGAGRLDVRHALRLARMPDPHEPNDWVAAALSQRPLHPGAVVVASLGYAGDRVDAYTVDVPAGTKARAVLRKGGAGLTLRSLPVKATDVLLARAARTRTRPAAQIALPGGRSLLVVTRGQGQGPYTLAFSGR